jgi:hypothetical protein
MVLLAAGPLGAQTTTDSAPPTAGDGGLPGSRPRLRVGGGIDARSLGPLGQLGVEWAQRGARPALRAELSAVRARASLGVGALTPGCDVGCAARTTSTRLGIGVDAKYEFLRGTLRPYVVSGLGLHRTRVRATRNFACVGTTTSPFVTACEPTGETLPFFSNTGVDVALHAGGGLAVMVGRTQLFGELRVQSVLDGGYGPRSGGATPLVFGVRF